MKIRWQIKDLIDLEYFLHIDTDDIKRGRRADISARDRHIFLQHIDSQLSAESSLPRRSAIKTWLERRRAVHQKTAGTEAALPGETYAEIFRLLRYALFIFGGLSGSGLAFSLLTYTGRAPLNVSTYLAAAVFVQILLLLLLAGLFVIRLIRPSLFYSSVVYSLVSRLIVYLFRKAKHRITASVSGAGREGASAVLGLIRGKKQIYGSLFFWPVFILVQIFAIGFNLGILGATLLRVLGTDMAFGWQSTLQVSATAVHAIVKGMAIPWAWVVPPGLAYPTLAQIEGSRLILKDGIYHLCTPDLVAWWPFLCFAVLVYGFLPRLLLYLFGGAIKRYLLGKIDFTHGACDQLVERMTTPEITFGMQTEVAGTPQSDTTVQAFTKNKPFTAEHSRIEKRFIVLVPDDIFDKCSDEDLKIIIAQSLGGNIKEKIRTGDTGTDEIIAIRRLVSSRGKDGWTHILILQEAWLPPIVENIAVIKALRHHLGNRTPIIVGLIGKPRTDTIFTPVRPAHWQTWETRLMALGDPYLRLERLVHGTT